MEGPVVVLGEGAVGGRRGFVGGNREPLGVADGVPISWVDETVGGVGDLVEGESRLAAGWLPADLGWEALGDGRELMVSEPRGEGSGGPAGGRGSVKPCSVGTASLLCTACEGSEDTTWLLTSLDEVPASSHTSFRR